MLCFRHTFFPRYDTHVLIDLPSNGSARTYHYYEHRGVRYDTILYNVQYISLYIYRRP